MKTDPKAIVDELRARAEERAKARGTRDENLHSFILGSFEFELEEAFRHCPNYAARVAKRIGLKPAKQPLDLKPCTDT